MLSAATVFGAQMNGFYTINSGAPATTTNFQNLSSAITYLTSASARSDAGPANSAPFGVAGPVTFDFASGSGPYVEQVTFPLITGVTATNNIVFNGNGCTIQFNPTAQATAHIIKFSGSKHVTLDSLIIKSLNNTFGWGVHFIASADSNTVKRCTIDLTANTVLSQQASCGIAFTNSTASLTTQGNNGTGNIITGNTITGSAAGGPYYGISLNQNSTTTITRNQITNNIIQNFYIYGIWMTYSNGALLKGNTIRNTNRTSTSTIYGIYLQNGTRNDTITGNRIHDPFGTLITTTNAFYGIYPIATNIPSGSALVLSNNLIYNVRSNGSQYGIYVNSAQNVFAYNNVISLDYTASTAGSTIQTYAYYTANSTSANGCGFRNNIVSLTRGGTTDKVGCYIATTGTAANYSIDYNSYHITGVGAAVGFNGGRFATMASWKKATNFIDQNGFQINPGFVNPTTGDFTPTEPLLNNYAGTLNAAVPTDINGNLKSVLADVGPYEFSTPHSEDASVISVIPPVAPFAAGKQAIFASIRNNGTATLSNVTINWSVNGVLQTPVSYTTPVNSYATATNIFLDSIIFSAGIKTDIAAWTSMPNNLADGAPANDSAYSLDNYSVLNGGTYTINSTAPASATNFQSFTALIAALNGGINGPMVINVNASSGPYTEQAAFKVIPGSSATNTVTINGNGRTIQFNNTAADWPIVSLEATKHLYIDNLIIKGLNNIYGVGVLFMSNADSNRVTNCTIDLTAQTSATTCAGIAFSASRTGVQTTGNNGIGNLIQGNTITGSPGGGVWFGITHCQSNVATPQRNRFINNIIQNFYNYGIYTTSSNRCSFIGNIIRNTNKTSMTTIYGFYSASGMRGDTVSNNIIENPFGTLITTTNGFYGIQINSPNATVTDGILVTNNIIRSVKSWGLQRGIDVTTGSNMKILHNTVILNNPTAAPTAATTTYGFYHNGAPAANGLEFRNNIIHINRPHPLCANVNMYFVSASANYTVNNNVYYKTGSGANSLVGHYAGGNFETFANWRTANSGLFDANGAFSNPMFVNVDNNSIPQDGSINNIGANVLVSVPTDFGGNARSATPDPGVFEFVPPTLDAAVAEVIPPATPFNAGSEPVNVKIKNPGLTTLTSVTINWSVNGLIQTPYSWTGSLTAGVTSANINIGNYTFASAVNHNIAAWTSAPNGGADPLMDNDSAYAGNIFTRMAGGTYTLNNTLPASATNFVSFNAMALALNNGGISGAVTVNVAAGPYTEQVLLNNIPGSSAANSLTINGNNRELRFNNTSTAAIYIMGLNGTKHLTLNGLRLTTQNTANGVGVLLTNNADSNIIENCVIDATSLTGGSSTTNAGIAICGSLANVTTLPTNSAGAANIIRNNTISGGPGIGPYYGIVVYATNNSNPSYSNNKILNNTITDPYIYGVYLSYSTRAAVKGNIISRPTKTAPTTFYGIYITSGSQADTIEANLITRPYGVLPTNTSQAYGIATVSMNSQLATPTIIKNNIINDFIGSGILYGIYNSTNSYLKVLGNTVNMDHAASTSTNASYAYYTTGAPAATGMQIRNNNFNVSRGGTGAKYAIYFNTASATGYVSNNNNLRSVTTGSNAHIGYYTANQTTFLNWKAANSAAFDQNSVSADPQFRNTVLPNFLQPGTDSLENLGAVLADLTIDFGGVARGATPDIGAYEFATNPNDAGITRFTQFGVGNTNFSVVSAIGQPVDITIKNYGTATLTSATVNWTLNGVAQTPMGWTGSVLKGDTIVHSLGFNNFQDSTIYSLKAWSTLPNGQTDSVNTNDTVIVRVCRPLAGKLSLDPTKPDTGINFTSFAGLFTALNTCGVAGPITVNIGGVTFNQQLTMPINIPGHNSLNPITFEGVDSALTRIVHNGTPVRPTLLLDGAKNYKFRNITFVGTSTTSATAVQLINTADSNSFTRCAFLVPTITSTAVNPFVVSGNITAATTGGNAANYLLVDSCTASGGYYGMVMMGIASPKSIGNTISNTVMSGSYLYGMYIQQQNKVSLIGNRIHSIGVALNYTTPYGIYMVGCDNDNKVMGNRVNNQLGGYGIWIQNFLGTTTNRSIVANNTIDIGSNATTVCYGLYDNTNGYTDFVFNSVRIFSTDANYVYCAFYTNAGTPVTYNNVRVLNNIFVTTGGALSIYVANQLNVPTALYEVNRNVYYSSSVYPFRVQGFITTTLANFSTSPQMLGVLPGNNANSLFMLPAFDVNMKSIDPLIDEAATPIAGVPNDIDGNPRNLTIPDIGAYEFVKSPNDAGVAVILNPVKPLVAGLNDIKVVIRNYGLNPLTAVDVTYRIGLTQHTVAYTGNIATLAYDTVIFNATSGPAASSQQYNFSGATETIKVWTSLPNASTDGVNTNDTATNTLCTGLGGTYTIDAAGSGPNNFTTIQSAIDKMICGGVYGHVVFNIASGTYTGQITIPTITGASDTSTVTFKSASNNAASVTLTSSNAGVNTNWTVRMLGAKFVNFQHVTLANTNSTYGRIVHIATDGLTNATSNNIELRNCILEGVNIASTSDLNALVYANAGNVTSFLSFVNNTFNNGSMGIYAGGPAIVNQFSQYIYIDSNTFNNQYYAATWFINRSFANVRRNMVNLSTSSPNTYGFYVSGMGAESYLTENTITNPAGIYGISISQQAYYALPGNATIANNLINMQNPSGTTYGISLGLSSQVNIFHNTVRVASSSPTSYALQITGHAPFLSGITNYPRSNTIAVRNNILHAQSGYAMRIGDTNADSALIDAFGLNNNLYYTAGTNLIYARLADYTSANFRSAYRNLYYNGSDDQSVNANLTFTSTTNLRPSATSPTIWNINGGAKSLFQYTPHFDGGIRSQTPSTGTPDIGAHEVTPNVEPNTAVITGTTALDSTQAVLVNSDTVAWITWGNSGTVPTALTAKYYPGSLISHSANYSTGTVGHSLDALWKINMTGGSSYFYSLKLKYRPQHLGTIPSESDIRLAVKDTGTAAFWIPSSFGATVLDTVEKTFKTNVLLISNEFTGTSDIAPLPVTMNYFEARRSNRNAQLNWATSSERNAWKFEVERSLEGSMFTKVNEVKAAGNSNSLLRYSYTDIAAADVARNGQIFYRLKMVNRDGSFTYSDVKLVRFDNLTSSITVYPNPFNNNVSIELSEEIKETATINVVDIYGKLVASATVEPNGSNIVNLSQMANLPVGVYIIKSQINGVEYTHKVVKN